MIISHITRYLFPLIVTILTLVVSTRFGLLQVPQPSDEKAVAVVAWRNLLSFLPALWLMSIGPTGLIANGGFIMQRLGIESGPKVVANFGLVWLVIGIFFAVVNNEMSETNPDQVVLEVIHAFSYVSAHVCIVAAIGVYVYLGANAMGLDKKRYHPRRVFLSYRREDAVAAALLIALYDRLRDEYGQNRVFRDLDSISPGQNFLEKVHQALEKSDAFLSIIGPKWLECLRERLESGSEDYLRLEIEQALEQDIPIIPVLVGGAEMPGSDDLPESLKGLSLMNAMRLDHGEFFSTHVYKLLDALEKLPVLRRRK